MQVERPMEQIQTINSNDFKAFQSFARKFIMFERTPIPNSFIAKVQESAINKLGLKNINQLRDRFEGQAFMDKKTLIFVGLFTLEKYLNSTFIQSPLNLEESQDLCKIKYKEKTYRIVPFIFGRLPILTNECKEPLIFCAVQPNFKSASIYGVLKDYNFSDNNLFSNKTNNPINIGFKFIGFNSLENLAK